MEINKWMEKIVTCLKRGKPLAGRGIIVEETPLGSRIHSKTISGSEGGGTAAYYCQITGRTGLYYNITVFDKMGGNALSSGYCLPINMTFSENIPSGSYIMAFNIITDVLS